MPSLDFDPGLCGDWLDVMLHDPTHPVRMLASHLRAISGVCLMSVGKQNPKLSRQVNLPESSGFCDVLLRRTPTSNRLRLLPKMPRLRINCFMRRSAAHAHSEVPLEDKSAFYNWDNSGTPCKS